MTPFQRTHIHLQTAIAGCVLILVSVVSALADGPKLFHIERTTNGICAAKLYDIETKSEKTVFSTNSKANSAEDCPKYILWDNEAKQTFYIIDAGHLWRRPFKDEKGPSEDMGTLPVPEIDKIWIEKNSGKIRIIYLHEIIDENVTVLKSNGKKTVLYDYEGKTYDTSELIGRSGWPQMAILYELDNKKWTMLKIRPTMSHDLDVLGERSERDEDISLVKLYSREPTCDNGGLDCTAKLNKSQEKLFSRYRSKKEQLHGRGRLALNSKDTVVFGVSRQGVEHSDGYAVFPVLICQDGCKDKKQIKEIKDISNDPSPTFGLTLATSDGYLLIGYANTNARVFDSAGNMMLHLPNSSNVLWFPK